MSIVIEALERRVLLSAVPVIAADQAKLRGDVLQVNNDSLRQGKLLASHSSIWKADVRRLNGSKGDQALVAAGRADAKACARALLNSFKAGTRGFASYTRALLRAGSNVAAVAANLAAYRVLLASIGQSMETDLTASQNKLTADLSALATSHPADAEFQSHMQTSIGNLTNSFQIARVNVTTFLSDSATIMHDVLEQLGGHE
jgi:uncharacterized membrane-anchored protein